MYVDHLKALWPRRGDDRDLALDGLRGLAVLLVVGTHTAASVMPLGGMVGVTAFFVLSGYLITTLLVRERETRGRVSYRAFYVRRALRLLPALLLVVAVTPLLMWAVGDPGFGPALVPATVVVVLYLSDFFWAAGNGLVIYAHTWSLSVEEQFYLVWPGLLALALGTRRSRGRAVRVVAGLTVAFVAWRLVAAATMDTQRVQFSLDTSAYALLMGALLALVPVTVGVRAARALVVLGAGGLVVFSLLPLAPETAAHEAVIVFGAPVAALLSVVAIIGARRSDLLLSLPPLVFFGRISYSLYLWHEVLLVLRPGGQVTEDLWRLPVVALSVVVAVASWVFVEAPALRLKRRFERTRLTVSTAHADKDAAPDDPRDLAGRAAVVYPGVPVADAVPDPVLDPAPDQPDPEPAVGVRPG